MSSRLLSPRPVPCMSLMNGARSLIRNQLSLHTDGCVVVIAAVLDRSFIRQGDFQWLCACCMFVLLCDYVSWVVTLVVLLFFLVVRGKRYKSVGAPEVYILFKVKIRIYGI